MEHHGGHLLPAAVSALEFLTLLLPLPLILVANWHDSPPPTPRNPHPRVPPAEPGGWSPAISWGPRAGGEGTYRRVASALGGLIWMLLAIVAAVSIVLALLSLAFTTPRTSGGAFAYALVLLATGAAAALLVAEPIRALLARVLPVDPRSALDATALVLSVVLVGSQLASQLAVDVLSQQAGAASALSPLDLVAQELPFLLAAALGVGLFVRRTPRGALDRLGFVRPTPWQLVFGLGAAFVFFAFGNGMDALSHVVSPATAQKVAAANEHLFGQLGNPVGIATIALSAGICEEALFRGALQPRLGILWTAIVFTAVHTQYGLSLDAVAVLVLAIGLGLLRRLTNTSTTTTCHVVYNTLVGVGVSGVLLGPAIVIGSALVMASAAAFFTGRLGSLTTAQ